MEQEVAPTDTIKPPKNNIYILQKNKRLIILLILLFLACLFYLFTLFKDQFIKQPVPYQLPVSKPEAYTSKLILSEIKDFPVYPNANFTNRINAKACEAGSQFGQTETCGATTYKWDTVDNFDKVVSWFEQKGLCVGQKTNVSPYQSEAIRTGCNKNGIIYGTSFEGSSNQTEINLYILYSSSPTDTSNWVPYINDVFGYSYKEPENWYGLQPPRKQTNIPERYGVSTFVNILNPVSISGPRKIEYTFEANLDEQGLKGLESTISANIGKITSHDYSVIGGKNTLTVKSVQLTDPHKQCPCYEKDVYFDLGNGTILPVYGQWWSTETDFEQIFDKFISTFNFTGQKLLAPPNWQYYIKGNVSIQYPYNWYHWTNEIEENELYDPSTLPKGQSIYTSTPKIYILVNSAMDWINKTAMDYVQLYKQNAEAKNLTLTIIDNKTVNGINSVLYNFNHEATNSLAISNGRTLILLHASIKNLNGNSIENQIIKTLRFINLQ